MFGASMLGGAGIGSRVSAAAQRLLHLARRKLRVATALPTSFGACIHRTHKMCTDAARKYSSAN